MIGLLVDIFEEDDEVPLVTHVFWGESKKECEEIFDDHQGMDDFLTAALTDGQLDGVPLHVERRWLKAGDMITVDEYSE